MRILRQFFFLPQQINIINSSSTRTTKARKVPGIVLVLMLAAMLFSKQGFGQAASSTWAGTANLNPVFAGNVSATAVTQTGVNAISANANGATATGWTTSGTRNTGEYFQYTITPAAGYDLTISTVSFTHQTSSGTWSGSIYYSTDGFVSSNTQIGANFAPTTSANAFSNSPTITVADGSTLTIRVYAWSSGNTSRSLFIKNMVLSGTTYSDAADIVVKSGYTYPQNIAYGTYQTTNITNSASDIEIAKFTLRDGGAAGTDGDVSPTILNSITFTIANSANVRRVALYDGVTELGEVAGGASVTFSALTLTAADNSTKDFSVRASFNAAVTDNQNIGLTITSVTESATNSHFAAANGGGAATSVAGNDNKIVVTATKLVYVQQPTNVNQYAAISPAVTIAAEDALNNIDADYVTNVSLTSTGTFAGTATTTVTPVSGVATFSNLTFSAAATLRTIAGTSGSLTATGNSSTFTISAYATATTDYFRSLSSGPYTTAGTWQSSHDNTNWLTATAAPTSSAVAINIQAGHTVTASANPSYNNLTVNGTYQASYNNATIPTATWSSTGTLLITGATGATAPSNLGQAFNNVTWNWTTQNGAVNLAGALTTVNGTLLINSTGSSTLAISNTTGSTITVGSFTMAGGTFFLNSTANSTTMNISGDWTKNGGSLTTDATHQSIVNFNGSSAQIIGGTQTTTFYNLTINQGSSANTVTNSSKAFAVGNNVTVTQGNLILSATDAGYNVTGDVIVSANGTLTHSVSWDTYGLPLTVSGNISVDGLLTHTVRSAISMNGVNKTIRSGNTAGSTFNILLIQNSSGTISTSGTVMVNDNFWSAFGAAGGTFSVASGTSVTATAGLFNNGGTFTVAGGSLTVTGGIAVGVTAGLAGTFNVSSGTVTTDGLTIGDGGSISGTSAISGGTINVNGTLTINTNGAVTVTNSPAINVTGNWANSGAYNKGTETVTFNGAAAQAISGSTATSFNSVTINNTVSDLTLSNSATINGTLTFTSGNIITGSNTLSLGSAATVSGAGQATGWVNGKLLRAIATGAQTKTFDIGDVTNYTPVTVAFTNVSTAGNLTATTTASEHPNIGTSIIDPSKSVNRYWSLTNSGIVFTNTGATASVTLNFVAGDKDGGSVFGNYIISNWNGSTWNVPTIGTRNSLNTAASALTALGDFAIGEALPVIANNTVSSTQIICSGATPSGLTGSTPTGGNGTYTYLWESSITSGTTGFTTATGTSNGQNYTPSSLSQTTWYRRTVTSAGRVDVSAAIQITVNSLPGDNAGVDKAFCAGGSTTIGAASVGGHTYSWSPSTGLNSSTLGNPTANPASTSTYTLTETITATGCSSVNSVIVTVNSLPSDNAGTDGPMCIGDNTVLGAANTAGHTYTWTPAGTLNSSTISNPTATPTTTTTYSLTETITATTCSLASSIIITVNPLPADKAVTAAATILCSGTGTNIQVAASVSGINYQLRNDANNATIGSPVGGNGGSINLPTGNLSSTTTFNVDAINATTGCDFELSTTVTIYVNPLPAVSVTPTSASICSGAGTILTATNSSGTVDQVFSKASGTISVAIADGSKAAYVYPTLTLVGGGATTLAAADVVQVTLSITHNNDGDLDIYLVDPSGTKAMLLTSDNGGTGNNYTNTVLTTNAGTSVTSGTAPFTNTYTVEGGISVAPDLTGAITGTYSAVVPASALLGATIDGAWSLRAFDDATNSNAGVLTSWALSITHNTSYTTVITGNPTLGAVSYSGVNNTTATASLTNPALGSNVYTATTTDGVGCTVSNTTTVTVNPLPSDNSGTDQTICNGASAGIGAVSTGGHTYSWSPNTALSSSTVSNPTSTATTTTTYTLTETITATGCSAANSVAVNVNPVPGNNTGGNKAICLNGSVTLGNTTVAGHTYNWSPATALSSSTISNPSANPTTTTTYTLTEVITATGCSSVNSITVTVNPLPVDNAGTDKTYCNGSNVVIGAGSVAGHTYSWSPATNLTSATASNPTASPTTTTTYTLTETITATTCTAANSVIVNVNPLAADNAGTDQAICRGASTGIGAGNTVGDTYSWSPATNLTSTTISNPTANPTATTTYTLTETITATGCTTSNTTIVTVNALPTPVIAASGPTTLCQGNTIVLAPNIGTAVQLNGTNNYAITPNLNASFPGSSVTIEIWFKANAPGVVVTELGSTTPNASWHDSQIEVLAGGTVQVRVWNLTAVTIGTVSFGTWNHAIVRYNSTTSKLDGFLNGVASASSSTGTRLTPQSGGVNQFWAVGATDGTNLGSGAYLNGQVDEMRIWNTALSNIQIAAQWNTTVPTNSASLVVYYKMDEGSGATLTDASGHSNNGTLVSSPTWVNPSLAPINYYSAYTWSPGGATTSSITVSTSNTYSVSVTDANTCTGSTSQAVTVNPVPGDNAGTDQVICNGSSTSLGAASIGGHTYSWSPAAGLNSSTVSNPTASPTATTTYTLTETITATGCNSVNTVQVINNPLPGNNTGGNKTICNTGSIGLGTTTVVGHTYNWSPATGLSSSTVSNPTANPTATTTYTLTEVITATGCSSVNSITVTVNPLPVVTINPNYCFGGGNIQLTTSPSTGSSYLWNNGSTTNPTLVDEAGIYVVTVTTTATGCTSSNSVTVAVELVTNGNFQAGNTGFTTGYTNNQTDLTTEGRYAITKDAHTQHALFYGTDHTSAPAGTGFFMAVNGSQLALQPIVWQETVAISPNTTYYFSAWATSLNAVGNNARLQFNVNGSQIGNEADLTNSNATAAPFPWTRFYGTWTSGPTDNSAIISIVDLQTAPGGNDFGLDDISCSTLSPVTFSITPSGNGGSPVCTGNTLPLSAGLIGGSSPFTFSWTGPNSFTSNQQNPIISNATSVNGGTYNLTVTDRYGCTVVGNTTVAIAQYPLDKTVSAVASTICTGSSTNIQVTGSQTGITYQLRNDANNANIGSGVTGTGGVINLPTGTLTSTTTFNVLATTTGSSCTTEMSVTPTVTINAKSTNPTSATATSTTICNGGSTTLTLNGGGGGTGAVIKWYSVSCGGTPQGTGNGLTVSPTTTTTYFGRYEDPAPCSVNTSCSSVTITVNALPTDKTFTAVASPICQGTATNIRNTTSQSGVKYQLRNDADNSNVGTFVNGTGGTINLPTGNLSATTTFNILATNNTTGCSVEMVNTVTVNINPSTVIGTQPVASTTVCSPTAVSLSVGATGTSLTYQWKFNAGNISGATTNSYSIPSTTAANTGSYTVVVTGTCGTTTSNAAAVTINVAPAITTDPASATVCLGSPINLSVVATGTPLNYQWRKNTGNITGATNSTYSIANSIATDAANYDVVITNTCGTTTSAIATITTSGAQSIPYLEDIESISVINQLPNCVTSTNLGSGTGTTTVGTNAHSGTDYAFFGSSANDWFFTPGINLTAGTAYEYAFYYKSTNSSVFQSLKGAVGTAPSSASMTTTVGTPLSHTDFTNSNYNQYAGVFIPSSTGVYYFGINATTNPGATSMFIDDISVTLACGGTPTAGTAAVSTTFLCAGTTADLSLTGYTTGFSGITFQWQSSPTGLNTWSNISGGTTANYTTTVTASSDYRCKVTCIYSGLSANSNSVTVSANIPSGNPTSASATLTSMCSGQSTTLTLNGGGGGTGEVLNWYSGSCGGTFAGTGNNLVVSPLVTTTYFGRYEDPAPCSPSTSCASVTVTVFTTPVATANNSGPYCSYQNILLSSGPAGLSSYHWSGPNSYTSISQNPTLAASGNQGTYSVTVTTVNGCTSTANTAVVVNVPLVVSVTPTASTICSTDTVALTASGSVDYSWSPATQLSSNIGALVNAFPSVSTTYTVTGTDANSCTTSATSAFTVKPVPAVSVTPPSTICTGATTVVLTASGAANGYTWQPSVFLSATTGSVVTAQISLLEFYTVTGTGGNGCTASVIVPVATVPAGGMVTPITNVICKGGTKKLTVSGAAGNFYQWQKSNNDSLWTDIAGATTTTYTTNSADGFIKRYYRMLAKSNACYNISSTTAIVDTSATPIVTITNVTSSSVTVTWKPYASGQYNLGWSGAAGSGSAAGVTTNVFTISGLLPNQNLLVNITPVTPVCSGVTPSTASTRTLCAKPTVTNVSATPVHGFKVNWTAVSGATSYRIYYRDLQVAPGWSFVDTAGLTKTISILYGGHTLAVYVVAKDCPGPGNLGDGSTPMRYVTTNPLQPCNPVPTVSASSNCPNQIHVDISGTPPFNLILRRISPGLTAGSSYPINSNSVDVTIGTQYAGTTWEIFATKSCGASIGVSAVSNIAVITVKPGCPVINNLVVSHPTCHGFTAAWNTDDCAGLGISGYQLLIKKNGTSNYNGYPVGSGDHTIVGWLAPGITYNVVVMSVACNGASSGYSIMDTIYVPACGGRTDDAPAEEASNSVGNDNESVSVYPNPANGKFYLDLSRTDLSEASVKIELVNQLGQVIQTNLGDIKGGHLNQMINAPEGLASGIYFVRTSVGNNVYVSRLMISKE